MRPVPSQTDRPVAYLTDVEGSWERLASFCAENGLVSLVDDRLRVADGAVFVFGGDAIDRGPWSRRIVRTLLSAKEAQPEQVVLLAGNRDLNKMRLVRELTGHPHRRAPAELAAAAPPVMLRWIFQNTMGAGDAFEHRRSELIAEGEDATDDAVAQSFLDDLAPDGPLSRYLRACQLSFRAGHTLFVHGGVAEEALTIVPGHAPTPLARFALEPWMDKLEGFYQSQMDAFAARALTADGRPVWEEAIVYQAPRKGLRMNPGSVVYGRMGDELNNPALPSPDVVDALWRSGVRRVVVGHTPSGDTPSIVRAAREPGPFEVIVADNSRSRVVTGSKLLVRDEGISVDARYALDDGEGRSLRFSLAADDQATPIGRRAEDGSLVKGPVDEGWLLFRYKPHFEVDQRVARELGPLREARD